MPRLAPAPSPNPCATRTTGIQPVRTSDLSSRGRVPPCLTVAQAFSLCQIPLPHRLEAPANHAPALQPVPVPQAFSLCAIASPPSFSWWNPSSGAQKAGLEGAVSLRWGSSPCSGDENPLKRIQSRLPADFHGLSEGLIPLRNGGQSVRRRQGLKPCLNSWKPLRG